MSRLGPKIGWSAVRAGEFQCVRIAALEIARVINAPTITLFDTPPARYSPACGIFRSRDEEYPDLIPFIEDGADDGAQGSHIVQAADCGRQA